MKLVWTKDFIVALVVIVAGVVLIALGIETDWAKGIVGIALGWALRLQIP